MREQQVFLPRLGSQPQNGPLVPSGDPVPTSCAVQGEAAKICTTHPVLAWTTEKDSPAAQQCFPFTWVVICITRST